MAEVFEACDGEIANFTTLIEAQLTLSGTTIANATADELRDAKKAVRDRYLGILLLMNADKVRYGKIIEDMQNDFLCGRDWYPENLTKAYQYLVNFKVDYRNYVSQPFGLGERDEMAFVAKAGQDKKDKSHIKCFHCGV